MTDPEQHQSDYPRKPIIDHQHDWRLHAVDPFEDTAPVNDALAAPTIVRIGKRFTWYCTVCRTIDTTELQEWPTPSDAPVYHDHTTDKAS